MNNEEIAKFLKNSDPPTLAAQIVIYRALGIHKQLAIQCMQELQYREKFGCTFDYNLYIENELNKFPQKIEPSQQDIFKNLFKIGIQNI